MAVIAVARSFAVMILIAVVRAQRSQSLIMKHLFTINQKHRWQLSPGPGETIVAFPDDAAPMRPLIFPPSPRSRGFQAFPPVSFPFAICNYERLVISRQRGARGVQLHFHARNALRGLNIIPREYVTRVNLRPRTPSGCREGRGTEAIYSALNAATRMPLSRKKRGARRKFAVTRIPRSFFFFSSLWPRRYFTFPCFPAAASLPCLLHLPRSAWTCPGSFQRRPPAASLDERAPPSRQPSATGVDSLTLPRHSRQPSLDTV